ncbi:hypothetical protein MED121_00100 [Marinomonas sp. MED121]|nr:hypothetical protein MED121_00100 [Marinomonas sp. MED121]
MIKKQGKIHSKNTLSRSINIKKGSSKAAYYAFLKEKLNYMFG